MGTAPTTPLKCEYVPYGVSLRSKVRPPAHQPTRDRTINARECGVGWVGRGLTGEPGIGGRIRGKLMGVSRGVRGVMGGVVGGCRGAFCPSVPPHSLITLVP